jgi:chorismate mutase
VQKIDQLRTEIDQIHVDMARLFRQRLLLSQKIWEIKKNNNIPLIDSDREKKIIHQFDLLIDDPNEQLAVQRFLKNILIETQSFLKAYLK